MLETYTNGLIYDLRKRLQPYGNIAVFDAANMPAFMQAVQNGQATYPCIQISGYSQLGEAGSYSSLRNDGSWTYYCFDINCCPVNIYYQAIIFGKTIDQVMNLSNVVRSLYQQDIALGFPNYAVQNEKVCIVLRANTAQEIVNSDPSSNTFFTRVSFMPTSTVLFFNQNDIANMHKNRNIDLEFLNMALYHANRSDGQAQNEMMQRYHFLFSSSVQAMTNRYVPKSLKQLRKLLQKGKAIDVAQFNNEFPHVVTLIPDLFNRYVNGETYEATLNNVEYLSALHEDRKNQICDVVGVMQDTNLNIDDKQQPRSSEALRFFIDTMNGNPNATLNDAMASYKNKLVEIHQENEENDARNQAMAEAVFNIATAAVVAHAASKVGGSVASLQKKDLLGSPACKYGAVFRNSCPVDCRLRDRCSRYR